MKLINLGEINPEEFFLLHNMLEMVSIPLNKKDNRKGFDEHRCACLGIVRSRKSGKIGLSAFSRKYPEIWTELKRIGKLFEPSGFTFTSVHLNKNVSCGQHRDKHNIGLSVIVAFGDYEGGRLLTEDGDDINTNCNAILFDGKNTTHWNSPLVAGTKYSLVFYTHECAINSA
jgi:hypothetical protein